MCAEAGVGFLLLLLVLLLSDPNAGLVLTKVATLGLTFSGTQGLEWYMSVWVILDKLLNFIITPSQYKTRQSYFNNFKSIKVI